MNDYERELVVGQRYHFTYEYGRELVVGQRYHFTYESAHIITHECDGFVIGIKSSASINKFGEDCAWFQPDSGFEIPKSWIEGESPPITGAFACLARHLTRTIPEIKIEHLL